MVDDDEGMTVPEVARRCKVTPMAVRNWIRGIRVGGRKVSLVSITVGTRDRVTDEALAAFKDECRRAKYGEPEPQRPPTKTQRERRVGRALAELHAMLGKGAAKAVTE